MYYIIAIWKIEKRKKYVPGREGKMFDKFLIT